MLRVNRPARRGRRFRSGAGPVGAARLFLLRVSRMISCVTIVVIAVLASGSAVRSDAVVLDVRRYPIFAGRYSVFARFQDALQRILTACNKSEQVIVPAGEVSRGKIGSETLRGIESALDCAALRNVPRQSAAKDGVLTRAVWRAVMSDEPLPTPEDRAHALIMSFEATDFGEKPEWNFCQDNHRTKRGPLDPRASGFICYNATDPCSFLTWGPRGATAGSGREIQWILWLAWRHDPLLVQRAFGREFGNLQRLLRLKGPQGRTCNGDTPLEYFMCALWSDPARRQIWDNALAELGHSRLVREAYAKVYALDEFDGGKLLAFFALWKELGLTPSEVDYAFFLDRATHLGGPPEGDQVNIGRLRACAREQTKALFANAAARRCLAELQPHDTQPEYRLARDVAFYLDAYPEGALSEKEIAAWAGYVPLSAVHNFGLSETNPAPIPTPAPLSLLGPDLPKPDSTRITPGERQACPPNVLVPLRRKTAE
jgi:hypothetical protein